MGDFPASTAGKTVSGEALEYLPAPPLQNTWPAYFRTFLPGSLGFGLGSGSVWNVEIFTMATPTSET